MEEFFRVLKEEENARLEGFDKESGTWMPHESAEGGTDTIGWGHKLTSTEQAGGYVVIGKEKVPFAQLTMDKADRLLKQDFNIASNKAKNWIGEGWDTLSGAKKTLAAELAYNVKTYDQYDDFKKKVLDGDASFIDEINRGYRDKEKNYIPLTKRTDALKKWYRSQTKKEEESGKQSNSGNYEQIKNMVAGGTDNIIASRMPQEEIVTETQEVVEQRPAGFKQLEQQMFNPMQSNYANQNLPKAPQNLERVELPPDQTITPYRETIKEDVTVRPDQIRVNEDIQLSTIPNDAYQYPVDAQQERARRSMMHGNYEDRMDDYQYSREYQEDYPYLYPNKRGSMQPFQIERRGMEAAQRMMGRGMGYAEGGSVNQAEGIASLGRGGDSTLVHMQPQEVAGLQQMAHSPS